MKLILINEGFWFSLFYLYDVLPIFSPPLEKQILSFSSPDSFSSLLSSPSLHPTTSHSLYFLIFPLSLSLLLQCPLLSHSIFSPLSIFFTSSFFFSPSSCPPHFPSPFNSLYLFLLLRSSFSHFLSPPYSLNVLFFILSILSTSASSLFPILSPSFSSLFSLPSPHIFPIVLSSSSSFSSSFTPLLHLPSPPYSLWLFPSLLVPIPSTSSTFFLPSFSHLPSPLHLTSPHSLNLLLFLLLLHFLILPSSYSSPLSWLPAYLHNFFFFRWCCFVFVLIRLIISPFPLFSPTPPHPPLYLSLYLFHCVPFLCHDWV